jgi:uncharacterized protein YhfF
VTTDLDALPPAEFAYPGPLRDRLVAAILSGAKTSTSSLVDEYGDGEPLPAVGDRSAVVDSDGRRVAAIEVTAVEVVRLGDVDLAHAVDEGEGYETVAQWRDAHEGFWRRYAPSVALDDDTLVVAERFRLL